MVGASVGLPVGALVGASVGGCVSSGVRIVDRLALQFSHEPPP